MNSFSKFLFMPLNLESRSFLRQIMYEIWGDEDSFSTYKTGNESLFAGGMNRWDLGCFRAEVKSRAGHG